MRRYTVITLFPELLHAFRATGIVEAERDGREVRIYATDGGGGFLIHGAIYDDGWQLHHWSHNGESRYIYDGSRGDYTLIEVKPRIKRTVWLNVWSNNVRSFCSEYAAGSEGQGRLACVKVEIDCEEGEGL